jgi:hypothetical protein
MQGRWQRRWLLNQEDVKARAIDFLKTAKKDSDVNLKPQLFQRFINNELLVNSSLDIKSVYGIELPISEETARAWMHNLGFHYSATAKDIYSDGHDRPDVIADREEVLERFFHEPDRNEAITYFKFHTVCVHFFFFRKRTFPSRNSSTSH